MRRFTVTYRVSFAKTTTIALEAPSEEDARTIAIESFDLSDVELDRSHFEILAVDRSD